MKTSKQRHTPIMRSHTPRHHTYQFASPSSKLLKENQGFHNLSSEIVSPVHKMNMTIRSLKTYRNSLGLGSKNMTLSSETARENTKRNHNADSANYFEVIFQADGGDHKFKSAATSIRMLKAQIRKIMRNKITEDQQLVLENKQQSLAFNYYLSLEDAKTSVFFGKTIRIQPFLPINQKSVSLCSFQIKRCIGCGGFSRVFLVRFKGDGRFYAMKVINKSFIVRNKKQQLVLNEKRIMVEVDHPLHAKLRWSFESKQSLIFVMDFYPGGELFSLIKSFRRMNERMARFYVIQILLALQKLHDIGVAYRDLKPQNILLDIEGHVHLADFGLVKPGLKGDEERAYSFCGSPQYMPPQVIARKGHTTTADFYSLGALLYELVTGLPPFYSRDPEKIYSATLNQPLVHFAHFSPDLKNILDGLLCKDNEKRLGARFGVREILQHPWFGHVNPQQYLQRKKDAPVKFNRLEDLVFDQVEVTPKDQEYLSKILKEQSSCDSFRAMFPSFYFQQSPEVISAEKLTNKPRKKTIKPFSRLRKRTEEIGCGASSWTRLNNFM